MYRLFFSLCVGLFFSIAIRAESPKKPNYPPSKTDNTVDVLHGVKVPDPYRWLERGDIPEVKDWTEKQNAFTRSILEPIPQRKKIAGRLNALLDTGTLSVIAPKKGRLFQTRREGKQNQPVLWMTDLTMMGPPDVKAVVDPNTLAQDGTVAMDWWFPSADGLLVAYGLSRNGNEVSTLKVRDTRTLKDLPDTIEFTRACSLAWKPDGKGFYYTRYPTPGTVPAGEEKYHRQVFFHELGTDPAKDPKVFGEGLHAADWPEVALSPNGRWLVVTVQKGWAHSEVYYRDLENVETKFEHLTAGLDAHFVPVVRNERIYLLTNFRAPRFVLYEVDPLKPDFKKWKLILSEDEDVLEGATVIGNQLVGLYLHQASSKLKLFDLIGKLEQDVPLPTLGTISGIGGEWDGNELYFSFQSFTTPPTVFKMDLRPGASKLNVPKIWGQVESSVVSADYQVEQIKYKSKDGTPITMFLTSKKGLKRDGKTPTLLYGYGGFTIKQTPIFNPSRFVFLENGGILAVANLRGGGEYGEAWHEAGMLGKKQNVFDDFIAAGEYLIQEKITDTDHLAIIGGSNGGLLVGAAVTQRPDLFKAAVCQVPLLDMVRYHRFLIAKLWIPEYGSADEDKEFHWLHAYSPYHRVKDGTKYPAILLTAAESDTRVDPLHARKMTARLQAATAADQPILLRLETKAGHGVGKPRGKVLEEQTDIWSFLFWQLGMK
jgi:prolyl oligopeptidase